MNQMPVKRQWKDETMQNEAVIAYVEKDWGNGKHYCPNRGFRIDIIRTVITYEDWRIWVDLLNSWGYWKDGKWVKRNPLDFKGLLTCFEFKQREAQQKKDEIQQSKAIRERGEQRIPKRSVSPMFDLRRGASGFKG